jgi:hypothetical protein
LINQGILSEKSLAQPGFNQVAFMARNRMELGTSKHGFRKRIRVSRQMQNGHAVGPPNLEIRHSEKRNK